MNAGEKQIAERRLAAIMIADVAGFSRLMERDESLTFTRLRKIREDITHARVETHGGRIIKTTGDGFLAEFSSTTTALKCGIDIQRAVIASQVRYPDDERIRFRIGINVGDIIVDGSDVAGDGVNIAARLEPLAPLDGIAISGSVREQIRDDLGVPFDDLGERELKNISRPIRVFTLRVEALPEPPPVSEPRRMAEVVRHEAEPAAVAPTAARGRLPLVALAIGGGVMAVVLGIFLSVKGAPAPEKAPASVAAPAPPSSPAGSPVAVKKPALPAWHADLRKALAQCKKEGGSFGCTEGARWKYCSPDHWDKVEECKVGR